MTEYVLGFLILILIWIVINLYRKLKAMEKIILSTENYRIALLMRISSAYQRIKAIDNRGTFESNDTVGWFFKFLFNEIEMLQKEFAEDGNSEASKEKTTKN